MLSLLLFTDACRYFLTKIHDSLGSFLTARGFQNVELTSPPVELCTDNAAMIAWTGMEMYEHGWESDLTCRALRRWSIDPNAQDGGILGADCWRKRDI